MRTTLNLDAELVEKAAALSGMSADDGEAFLIGRVVEAKAELAEIAGWLAQHIR